MSNTYRCFSTTNEVSEEGVVLVLRQEAGCLFYLSYMLHYFVSNRTQQSPPAPVHALALEGNVHKFCNRLKKWVFPFRNQSLFWWRFHCEVPLLRSVLSNLFFFLSAFQALYKICIQIAVAALTLVRYISQDNDPRMRLFLIGALQSGKTKSWSKML